MKEEKNSYSRSAFKVGAVALAFLITGYQTSLFIHRAAVLRIEAVRDRPDTVYVVDEALAARLLEEKPATAICGTPANDSPAGWRVEIRKDAGHSPEVESVRKERRRTESFRFNPNTVSVSDLQRLGFSEKQALAINSYREKGGRFRRKSDFAKSFVVADSVYRRLEKYIDIPKVDINRADSAEFDGLPGIGGWFASRMVEYREELGGYSCTEQLMEIHRFDREKYDGLADLICCSPPGSPLRLWELPEEELSRHPYFRNKRTAGAIVFYRNHNSPDKWTVDGLEAAGVIDSETAARLRRCATVPPPGVTSSDDGQERTTAR